MNCYLSTFLHRLLFNIKSIILMHICIFPEGQKSAFTFYDKFTWRGISLSLLDLILP